MTPKRSFAAVVCACCITIPLAAQPSDLGHVEFPTSASAPAQQQFIRGVLLLHSFEYVDARAAFQEAERLEPNFAMAYWGEALTQTHPLWEQQDVTAARAALNRLGPSPEARFAKAPTEREKDYMRAVEALYGDGDKLSRDLAYAEAMSRVHQRYPEDLEATSFYALALLGTCEGKRDFATYMKAAAILEEVFAKNPRHPGAAHYLIHSYDDPIHAPLGLRAARIYARIAPAASHAQHMPSHIFLALGMWDDVTASNEVSWRVADERVTRTGRPTDERNYHALYWLGYGYLQQGRYEDARRTLATMQQDAGKSGSARTRMHLALMRSNYIIETQKWEIGSPTIDYTGVQRFAVNADLFATGISAVKLGDLAAANRALAAMRTHQPVPTTNAAMHHEGADDPAAAAAGIMETELNALIEAASGRREQGLELMKKAVAAENAMSYGFGPPVPIKPAHELYGEMLLKAGQPGAALEEFDLALARAPGRVLSILGVISAARRTGDAIKAADNAAILKRIWHRADPGTLKILEPTDAATNSGSTQPQF